MPSELTSLLQAASSGDQPALNRVVALLYVDLRQLATRCKSHHRGNTLETTGLVHECYMRFVNSGQLQISDRSHFLNLAARIMRQLLCDYARERLADKRGGNSIHLDLHDSDAAERHEAERWLAVDQALERLAEIRPQLARVVECRFFAGLTQQETAEALDRSLRSIQRDWAEARKWLADRLKT